MSGARLRLPALLLTLATAGCQLASAGSSPIPGPSPSVPGITIVGTGAGQAAEAVWLVLRRHTARAYLAAASRGAGVQAQDAEPSGHAGAVGYIGRATCDVKRHPRVRVVRCRGHVWRRDISLTAFTVDPDLSTATLRMRAGGRRHVARWFGRGDGPDPDSYYSVQPDFVLLQAGAGAKRRARASARIFGQRVGAERLRFARLGEGAGAFALSLGVVPLGRSSFEREFRIRR